MNICEMKIGREKDCFYCAPVGSCVIIALRDPKQLLGGMVHCLLPAREMGYNNSGFNELPAKFVNESIPALIEWLIAVGANKDSLVAKIAGGASVIHFEDEADVITIGKRNVDAALKVLRELRIPVLAQDVGGQHGRSVDFDITSGELRTSNTKIGEKVL